MEAGQWPQRGRCPIEHMGSFRLVGGQRPEAGGCACVSVSVRTCMRTCVCDAHCEEGRGDEGKGRRGVEGRNWREGDGRRKGEGRRGREGQQKNIFFMPQSRRLYFLNELSYDVLTHLILNISKRSFQRI